MPFPLVIWEPGLFEISNSARKDVAMSAVRHVVDVSLRTNGRICFKSDVIDVRSTIGPAAERKQQLQHVAANNKRLSVKTTNAGGRVARLMHEPLASRRLVRPVYARWTLVQSSSTRSDN